MTNYTRGTIWADGQELTDTALNEEFDRIAAVINGGLELSNFAAGEIETPIIINAGDPRFQTGGLDRAERVAGAVAEAAAAGGRRVVWVPRSMFGYGEDAGWSSGIFDTGVHVVREGQLDAGHDVVAYGAKPDDAAVDDKPMFDVAVTQAAASIIGLNPGGSWFSVSLPGTYQLNTDVTIPTPVTVGWLRLAACLLAGAGNVVTADPSVDYVGLYCEENIASITPTFPVAPVNIPLSSSATVQLAQTMSALGKGRLYVPEFRWKEDAGAFGDWVRLASGMTMGNFTVSWDELSVQAGGFTTKWGVTNNDGAAAHDITFEVRVTAIKLEPHEV
jgi:hypothetical protein